jgi:LytS/YehU family sensor histidine kinase
MLLDLRFGIDKLTIFGGTLVFSYTYTLARQFAANERLKREAAVRSIRLENQLLKRSINPHSLLNSLTSIIVWLKKEPAKARELVEALSDEFRLISQVSNLPRIPIRQELALCESHLRIMSCRRNSSFVLEHEGLDLDEEIPPMIFHTLVENGVTHGYEKKARGKFILERTRFPGGVTYRLSNDGETLPPVDSRHDGTGYKYIRARLEESFPGRWALSQRTLDAGFEVQITLYDPGRKKS